MNEVMHFTNNPETKEIAEVKVSHNGNVYGAGWANLVREYLKTGYAGEAVQCEVESFGKIYKVLKRDKVTAFYDEAGNTLFDVVNERLQKEYEWLMKDNACQKAEQSAEKRERVEEEGSSDAVEKVCAVPAEKENGTEAGEASEQKQEEEPEKPAVVYAGVGGVEAKLKAELEKTKQKDFAKPIIEYLIDRCRESESLAADICQAHKTWEKCYGYIVANARKKLNNVSGPVHSDTVFEWAEDYYHKDDKAEEERKAQKEAEDKAKREKAMAERKNTKNTGTGKAEKAPASKKIEIPKEPTKPKRNGKDMEGQMDMFSMMGM